MRNWLLIVVFACSSSTLAQDASKRSSDFSEGLQQRADSLEMIWSTDAQRPAPTLLKSPVLRCNDPTRGEADGAVWIWLDGKRPVTAMCLLQYVGGRQNYEFVSLCDEALRVSGRPDWSWEPEATARAWTRLEDSVPDTAMKRQFAMRGLVRRFEVTEFYRGQNFTLRLLNRPIYSYADEEHGVKEGAIFAFTNGTNPEVLVQLEARHDNSDAWYVSYARLGSAALTVKLDEKEAWTAEAIEAHDESKSYFATNERPVKP